MFEVYASPKPLCTLPASGLDCDGFLGEVAMAFACGPLIREIGRGKEGARSLSREQAVQLYAAMLAGEVSELELGAVLIALRVKGESADELSGFCQAVMSAVSPISAPAAAALPTLVFPSYNGARRRPNLLPLLAGALARLGYPVLVHGLLDDPTGRITTAAVFSELRWPAYRALHERPGFESGGKPGADAVCESESVGNALSSALADAYNQRWPLFVPTQCIHPGLVSLLDRRRILGVRNCTHTIVKLLQPMTGPACLVTSYTHPEFFRLQREVLAAMGTSAIVLRGHEGEAVAHPQKAPRMDAVHAGQTWCLDTGDETFTDLPERSPDKQAAHTAEQTLSCLIQMDRIGVAALPPGLRRQIAAIDAFSATLTAPAGTCDH